MDVDDIDPKLTELCNECTIQENKRGFFNVLLEDVLMNSRIKEWTDDIWNQNLSEYDFLSALNKEEDIIKTMCEVFSVQEVFRKKDDNVAAKIVNEAEKCSDHVKALELFNQATIKSSVQYSPAILKKRATFLQTINMGSFSIKDLRLALDILTENDDTLTKQSSMKSSEKISLTAEIRKQLDEALKTNSCSPGDTENYRLPAVAGGDNILLEGASRIVKMSEDIHQGRHAVAAENIAVGDTLVVENPFVSCLKTQFFGSHCQHCFKRLKASVGCPDCCAVAFCSQECRDIAVNSYHKYECKFMDLFIGSGMSIGCHTALRIVTQEGLTGSLEMFEKYLKVNQKDTKPDKTSLMFNLCKHRHMRTPSDYLRRLIMAFFLLRCLQKNTFFNTSQQKKHPNNTLTSEEISVLAILLFAVQAIQFNAHEIIEEGSSTHPRQEIALAIYPTSSLFNHDCYPGVVRYFVGKTLVIRAVRPGNAGYVIGDNYGPRFERQAKQVRLRALRSRYWFKCTCNACTEAWLTPPASQIILKCVTDNCDGKLKPNNDEELKCSVCKVNVPNNYITHKLDIIKECVKKYEEGLQIFRNAGDSFKGLHLLTSALTLFHENAYPPHAPTHAAEDTLRRYYTRIATSEKF